MYVLYYNFKTVNFLLCVIMKNNYVTFIQKMYGYVTRSVFIQKQKIQVSTLSGFKVIIQNVHVQFLFCNSIGDKCPCHDLTLQTDVARLGSNLRLLDYQSVLPSKPLCAVNN